METIGKIRLLTIQTAQEISEQNCSKLDAVGWSIFDADCYWSSGEPHPEQHLGSYLHEQERHFILHALESCDWRIMETAERLGISRKNLWEKMQRYGLSRPIDKEKL